MRLKGRHWVLLWLALFLLVATAVVTRQSAAFRMSRELEGLREERIALEARRAELEQRIRALSSRQALADRVRRLGLRDPADSETVIIGPPAPDPGNSR